ncbi:MAG: ribulose-phosphate 3-epimerase [Candidatus Omnitrophica bacterium]|nr:ribulose-phosphate 3-epimerase [Candidatus Omnitrophota bacterium]
MRIKVAASSLSADCICLADDVKRVENAGADLIHVDVMDGHFVPNITIGPLVVRSLRKVTKLPLDVHLMIENPDKYVQGFVEAGSDMITMHIETIDADNFIKISKDLKIKKVLAGVSLNPDTDLEKIKPVLSDVDFVLVMSVFPGFGGQEFIPESVEKIKQLRSIFKGDISVDGGINDKTAKQVIAAGANILAAGSYIFGAKDVKQAIERIRHGN